jgi:hypothetical protein
MGGDYETVSATSLKRWRGKAIVSKIFFFLNFATVLLNFGHFSGRKSRLQKKVFGEN